MRLVLFQLFLKQGKNVFIFLLKNLTNHAKKSYREKKTGPKKTRKKSPSCLILRVKGFNARHDKYELNLIRHVMLWFKRACLDPKVVVFNRQCLLLCVAGCSPLCPVRVHTLRVGVRLLSRLSVVANFLKCQLLRDDVAQRTFSGRNTIIYKEANF